MLIITVTGPSTATGAKSGGVRDRRSMSNIEQQARAIRNRVDRNLKFAIARALTQTAKFASEELTKEIPSIFESPTQFTQRAIGFAPASRSKQEARVFVKDAQAEYLKRQEEGGTRTPEPGSPINVPVGINVNRYGNIAQGGIARKRQRPDTFVSSQAGKTRHLPPGLYQRAKLTKRRDGTKGTGGPLRQGGKGRKVGGRAAKGATSLKLLVAFERQASYEPRFRFRERVGIIVKAKLKRNIEDSIADAMRTMR